MMRWTPEQHAEYVERIKRKFAPKRTDPILNGVDEPESTLQRMIETWCEEHGYPYFHDRSRGANRSGFPDLVIALPAGRTLWVELKSSRGRMSAAQNRWRMMLLHLGHEHHVIRSYREFLRVAAT